MAEKPIAITTRCCAPCAVSMASRQATHARLDSIWSPPCAMVRNTSWRLCSEAKPRAHAILACGRCCIVPCAKPQRAKHANPRQCSLPNPNVSHEPANALRPAKHLRPSVCLPLLQDLSKEPSFQDRQLHLDRSRSGRARRNPVPPNRVSSNRLKHALPSSSASPSLVSYNPALQWPVSDRFLSWHPSALPARRWHLSLSHHPFANQHRCVWRVPTPCRQCQICAAQRELAVAAPLQH